MSSSGEDLHYLISRLNAAREEERISLARELHDNLGQTLTCIKLDLALLIRHAVPRGKSKNPRDSVALAEEIDTDGVRFLPADSARRLRKALITAHYDKIIVLVEEIREKNPGLATELHTMADNFDYAGMRDLLD